MKKRLIILFLMAAVLLAACTQNENKHIYETAVNDQQFTVDTKQNTITHEGDLYRYESGEWPNILLGILLCGVGVLNIFHPEFGWYLKLGWKIRDGEPSDLYLGLARFGGGVSALVGIIVILVAIFGS